MTTKGPARYTHLDEPAMEYMREAPRKYARLKELLGCSDCAMRIVLQRLTYGGRITHRSKGWEPKVVEVTKDPSPFPKPWWHTPNVGWFG